MPEFVHIASPAASVETRPPRSAASLYWLQGVTIAWMMVELSVSAYAAWEARSAAIFAFGADSLVEVFSAVVVLLPTVSRLRFSERKAARTAGALLFVLAGVVGISAIASLLLGIKPEACAAGLAITAAALLVMPLLAVWKRREARRRGNASLAADAAQSATCAYLALTALTGMTVNRIFHLAWFDSAAALLCLPLLIHEGREAWKGSVCGCCGV